MVARKDARIAKKIAVFIKNNREKKYPGWGGKTIAARAFGVKLGVWARWETGQSVPDDVNQRRLAEFFGVTLAELRGDHEKPSAEAEGVDLIADLQVGEAIQKAVSQHLAALAVILSTKGIARDRDQQDALRAIQAASLALQKSYEERPASEGAPPSLPAVPPRKRARS